jgi:hypothetical protein
VQPTAQQDVWWHGSGLAGEMEEHRLGHVLRLVRVAADLNDFQGI